MEQRPLILIADDDFEDRFIMSETFNELGYGNSIAFVEDGIRLMEYLEQKGADSVDLIILDLNMPRLSGTEILRILKTNEKYEPITVIIFSTSVNEIEKDNCMALGAKEYITKPAKYSEYLETCKKLYDISVAAMPS